MPTKNDYKLAQQCLLPIEERMELSSDPWMVLGLRIVMPPRIINPETLTAIHKGLLHKHRDNDTAIEAINRAVRELS